MASAGNASAIADECVAARWSRHDEINPAIHGSNWDGHVKISGKLGAVAITVGAVATSYASRADHEACSVTRIRGTVCSKSNLL
jgi:hypothetical protein